MATKAQLTKAGTTAKRTSSSSPAKSSSKPRAPSPLRSPAKPHVASRAERYHHGDLQQALLSAAETVLERDGLQGLTLRAVAREAGVSHAAPAHHFGDLTGLVSELAAIGFLRFNGAMREAGEVAGTPIAKAKARARAYLAYALANPAMYGLMFRTERLDMTRPALREAADASFAGLAGAIGVPGHTQINHKPLTIDHAAQIVKAWSLLHGYAMLMLDGRLRGVFNLLPDDVDADALLVAMLQAPLRPD